MERSNPGFENILIATLRMVRTSWKIPTCLFLLNDDGALRMRAGDGIPRVKQASIRFDGKKHPISTCIQEDKVIEKTGSPGDPLSRLLKIGSRKDQKYVLVPVSGESRVLGLLVLGPFKKGTEVLSRERELRSAGALCAVLSAHWRLYEWMSQFLPDINQKLRTPLTAVQGSIGVLLGGMCGHVGGEVREMLEMAQKGCERTVRTIESYLTQQTLPPKND
ncbi:MAG: histidine kinase dimerization/phospho-acceptor domain-containing protein [Elusimicrobiota bacterium]|jgi:hypothetical protein